MAVPLSAAAASSTQRPCSELQWWPSGTLLSFAVSQLPRQPLPAVTGLDKATAQKILKVWEETGAGSSPDALRKMLINRSIRTLGTVLLQVGLDTGPPSALPAPLCSSRRQPLPDVLMVARLCVQARPGAPSPRPGTSRAAATSSARSPWSTWPMRWGSTLASVRRVPPSAASAARGGAAPLIGIGYRDTYTLALTACGMSRRRGAGRVPAGRDRLCGVPVLHQRGGLPAGRAPGVPWPATSLEGPECLLAARTAVSQRSRCKSVSGVRLFAKFRARPVSAGGRHQVPDRAGGGGQGAERGKPRQGHQCAEQDLGHAQGAPPPCAKRRTCGRRPRCRRSARLAG